MCLGANNGFNSAPDQSLANVACDELVRWLVLRLDQTMYQCYASHAGNKLHLSRIKQTDLTMFRTSCACYEVWQLMAMVTKS